jgi:hypothetical protein
VKNYPAFAAYNLEDDFDNERFIDELGGEATPSLLSDILMSDEDEFEVKPGCPTPCPFPLPAKGQFSSPNRKGHRWFNPEYRQYPNNIWHLAKVVRTRMFAMSDPPGRGVPSHLAIRNAIKLDPCNSHFTRQKPMFMPRFGADGCSGKGSNYGAIYIPFRFD